MPLQKQIVPIDFTNGIENKKDPRLAIAGKFTRVVNGDFAGADSVRKRSGTLLMPSTTTAITAMWAYKDSVVAAGVAKSTFQEFAPGSNPRNGTWNSKGVCSLDTVASKQVLRNSASQSAADSASIAGVSVWAWEDSRGGIRISVFDESSGAAYQTDVQLTATGLQPRCVAIGTTISVIYIDGTNLKLARILTGTPTAIQAAVNISTNARGGVNARLDARVQADGAHVIMAHRRNTDDTIDVTQTDIAGAVTAGPTNLAQIPTGTLAIGSFSDSTIGVFWSGATNLDVSVYNGTTLALIGGVTPEVAAATQIIKVTAVAHGTKLLAVYELTAAATYNHLTKYVEITTVPAISTAATVFLRGVGLASQAFLFDGEIHVGLVFDSTLQPTLFVAGVTGNAIQRVMAKALVWRSGGVLSKTLPHVLNENTSTVSLVAGERGRLQFKKGINVTPVGVSRVDLGSSTTSWRSAVEFNNVLYIAGACPAIYDGFSVVESDFHIFPENFSANDAGGGGALSAGTYQYIVVYEWTDGRGTRHQSIAGVPVSITLAAAHQVDVIISTLRLTRKRSDMSASNVTLVVYRTVASGSVFYRTVPGDIPALAPSNDVTVDTVVYRDNNADSAIISNEILYITGGTLDNEPCPPCRAFAVYQDRLWAIGLEDPLRFAYSKQRAAGEGMGFHELLQGVVPGDYGRLSGAAPMDDKMLLFAEGGPWVIAGPGPNAQGQQNGFSDPTKIPAGFGCRYGKARSVAPDPAGTWFLSPQGLRLLGRTLEIARDQEGKPLGMDMDTLATDCTAVIAPTFPTLTDITGAPEPITSSQVLFYVGNGSVLVWDYQWGRWSQYTNMPAADATLLQGYPFWISSAGVPRWQNPSHAYLNGNSVDDLYSAPVPYDMIVETGWLKVGSIQGYQRAYAVLMLGTLSTDDSHLKIAAANDYVETYSADADFTFTGAAQVAPNPVQLRRDFAIQKGEAIRLRVTFTDPDAIGALFRLSNMALVLGMKKGAMRLGAAQQF